MSRKGATAGFMLLGSSAAWLVADAAERRLAIPAWPVFMALFLLLAAWPVLWLWSDDP